MKKACNNFSIFNCRTVANQSGYPTFLHCLRLYSLHSYRDNVIQTSYHVSKHLFFFGRKLRHESDHLSRFNVRHLERFAKLVVLIQNTAPWEQVNDTVERWKKQSFVETILAKSVNNFLFYESLPFFIRLNFL